MIVVPPNIPPTPTTILKDPTNKTETKELVLQRILVIDITYKFPDHTETFHHERSG